MGRMPISYRNSLIMKTCEFMIPWSINPRFQGLCSSMRVISFPFWSDRGNGWSSERALSRHSLRGERLAASWAGLAITKSNTAREALACFGTPDDLLIAVRQGFLTQDLVGSFAGRLNMLG